MERFEAEAGAFGPALAIDVPFDPKAVFGRVRAPVRVTINGHTFRTTIARMGGRTIIGLNRQVREAAGVEAGQRVIVEVELDDQPRTVDPPPELLTAFAQEPVVKTFFDSLSYTNRREYAEWIESAKRDETRRRRAAKAVELLRRSAPHP